MFRFTRHITRPFTRTALMVFAWNHRNEIERWVRSLWTELRAPSEISASRLKTLATILWRCEPRSSAHRFASAPQRSLVGDAVELDVDPMWKHTPRLINEVRTISGVTDVSVRSA